MSFSTSFKPLLPRLGLLALLGLTSLATQAQTAPTWASVQRVGAATANSGSFGRKIALAPDGSQFVTGFFEGTITLGTVTLTEGPGAGDGHMFLAKYNPDGTVAWATALESSNGDVYSNVAADAAGNVYIVGYFADDLTLGSTTLTSDGNDAYIAKYNGQGVLQWVRQGGSEGAFAQGVAVDASGNVLIAGDFNDAISFGGPTVTGEGIFLARLSPTGTVVQTNVIGTLGLANDLALDAAGNAYITGSFGQTASFGTISLTSAGESDMYVCKVSPAGVILWAQRDGDAFEDSGLSVAVDANGNPVVAGFYNGVDIGNDNDSGIYVARFTTQGSPVWTKRIKPSALGEYVANEVAYDNRGGYYVTGGFQGTAAFGSTVLNSVGKACSWPASTAPATCCGPIKPTALLPTTFPPA
ncbi:hypothetical protein [Hymenobacter cellulosilyticus]|uniref:Bulb-type lectin domain-containing protein n=1 Tax=Hymenobacter cellulosilyticus TaxID=2932248 RepID=A0A8T9Q9D2_9BACT|nr:hypothetical protein [Hymenobacter cellulosilyticus]UOQ72119.1 hypothetical protein MUN79_26725 [Hymenobacter cellulosilyticus]